MRDHYKARDVAVASGYTEPQATGLRKYCPRCERGGWIFLLDGPRALIVWDGPTRLAPEDQEALASGKIDLDACKPEDVFDPSFGCGTCNGDKRVDW